MYTYVCMCYNLFKENAQNLSLQPAEFLTNVYIHVNHHANGDTEHFYYPRTFHHNHYSQTLVSVSRNNRYDIFQEGPACSRVSYKWN